MSEKQNKKGEQKQTVEFENRTSEITLEELRELNSFKNYSEQQAECLIRSIKAFARIIYNNWSRKQQADTKIIELNKTEPLNKAA